jgi:hypothetical protein
MPTTAFKVLQDPLILGMTKKFGVQLLILPLVCEKYE